MASDFTVVFADNQHFGNDPSSLYGTFRGDDYTYRFDCPGIDISQGAIWFAECQGVEYYNKFTLNGREIWSLDYPSKGRHVDNSTIPSQILQETGNTLLIEASNIQGKTRTEGGAGNLDDFVIDNFVIFYKTRN